MDEAEEATLDQADTSNTPHRKTISGNVLSRLPFMRSNSSNADKSSSATDGSNDGERALLPGGNSLSIVQQNSKIRKRKGSLRKTALLGKGMLGRDRKGSDAKAPKSPLSGPRAPADKENTTVALNAPNQLATEAEKKPRPNQEDSVSPIAAPASWKRGFPTSKISLSSLRSSSSFIKPASSLDASTVPNNPRRAFDRSTPDQDDQPPISPKPPPTMPRKSPSAGRESYFESQAPPPPPPPLPPFRSRRSATGITNRIKSPLATQPQSLTSSPAPSEEEWDYSETAYWGYVILVITWLVFVVGMGSCFDVWSWAWDVGETPYAPPELNDDPTLPIVGYYPALMVLTSVMAWVWVVVAWVGMKYFRHAEGRADDG